MAKDEYAGRRTNCPDCGRELVIPSASQDVFEAEDYPPRPGLAPDVGPQKAAEYREGGTSGKAITSLVLGLFSCLCLLLGIPGLILGILGLGDINRSQGRLGGKGLAIAGIAINSIGLVLSLILVPIALLLPAVQAAREAARRAQCTNNLKQIGLAMHNFHDAQGRFPAQAITDKEGKPLLSWRVAILPYIEQQGLYSQFHLDEPWDSPHNMALASQMPTTYLCPSRPALNRSQGLTTYQVLAGPGTMFDGPQGVGIASITDGTSNTLLVVEATNPVPWTKPDDIAVPPGQIPTGLGSMHPGGYNALFADGSVKFLKNSLSPQVLRALATRNGNEVVSSDVY
jgi:prepilin-type processing-associated H-X9-DG protein